MTRIADLHSEWLKDPFYKAAYDALEDEYARLAAGLLAQPGNLDLLFQIYRGAEDGYGWRLIGRDGKVLASSEGYKTSEEARYAIDTLRAGLVGAQIVETAA